MDTVLNPDEVIDLIIALIAVPLLLAVVRVRPVREGRLFAAGYVFWLCALVATIAEGFIWPDFLNVLEHLCYAGMGVSFLWAIARTSREYRTPRSESP